MCGDIQLAEDALHEACVQAEKQWPQQDLPSSTGAWLFSVAKRRLIDCMRARSRHNSALTLSEIMHASEGQTSVEGAQEIPDERLALIFTCCHPALNQDAQVALTLKTLCGLTVREIARAFLVSDTAMQKRLQRAKNKLHSNAVAYRVPSGDQLPPRVQSVLSVVYLIFNESYTAYEGQSLTRDDLADESIRLARLMHTLLPTPEVAGLLALLFLHQSRRRARLNHRGDLVPLEHQDRALWDRSLVKEGCSLLFEALAQGQPGKYQIQAAISAIHSSAEHWQTTDWAQILGLYRQLKKYQPGAITQLNTMVAVAFSGNPALAHKGLRQLADELAGYQPYHVAKAYIELELGNHKAALASYECAINMCQNKTEKAFLVLRRDELTAR